MADHINLFVHGIHFVRYHTSQYQRSKLFKYHRLYSRSSMYRCYHHDSYYHSNCYYDNYDHVVITSDGQEDSVHNILIISSQSY